MQPLHWCPRLPPFWERVLLTQLAGFYHLVFFLKTFVGGLAIGRGMLSRRELFQLFQDAKCHLLANGSQQNARNKAYSCLKRNFFGKWKEFHAEKRKSVLLTGSIVVFTLLLSWQNGVFWPQGSLLFGIHKFSRQDCPKILLHLFEQGTLLFLSVGKLWLKGVYQVVLFVSEICQFYVCQKLVK